MQDFEQALTAGNVKAAMKEAGAASPVKGFGVDKEIKQAISNFQHHENCVFRYARSLYRKNGGTYTGNGNDGWKADDQDAVNRYIEQARAYYKK